MKPKFIAAIVFISICILIFAVNFTAGSVKDWVIEFFLPSELEQVVPATSLVLLPIDSAISIWDSVKLVGSSFLDVFISLFKWEIGSLVTAIFLVLIGALSLITNVALIVLSIPVAIIAILLGWLLTLSILFPGVSALIALLSIIWGIYEYIKNR